METTKPDQVFISTYGCQMNEHDTERMYALLEAQGFWQAPSALEADVIIINSCAVREKPVHKVMSEIGTYHSLKKSRPQLKIGVGGCVAQQEGKKLLATSPLLDFVFGTDVIDDLPAIVSDVRQKNIRGVWVQMAHKAPYEIETKIRNSRVSAFVSITKGCDNFCTFCIVPFTRGREKSRLLSELIQDVRNLVARGIKEVTLLGQNVNSYKSPDGNGGFNDLLRAVCTETDIERVRFTTSHPKDFNEDLIDVLVKYQSKLGQYLHLPVQSGSSRILERMNRGYTREEYCEKITKLKTVMPEISLSTDIIVGFPGETEEDFEQTLTLVEAIGYENVYGFKYSPRPFTKALKYDGQVAENIKDNRLQRLLAWQDGKASSICQKYDGGVFEVLVEGPSRTNREVLTGRTAHNKVVNFMAGPEAVGKILPIKITKAQQFSLRGEIFYGERFLKTEQGGIS